MRGPNPRTARLLRSSPSLGTLVAASIRGTQDVIPRVPSGVLVAVLEDGPADVADLLEPDRRRSRSVDVVRRGARDGAPTEAHLRQVDARDDERPAEVAGQGLAR